MSQPNHKEEGMRLTWYGHSNFLLRQNGTTLLVDPFFEGNPTAPVSHEDVEKIDAVLLTHDHQDHVGQAVEICRSRKVPLVGVFDTLKSLFAQGLPQDLGIGMNIGGTVQVAGADVHMVQAMHSSATGAATGFIITFPDGFCVYHSGDTGIFSSMQLFSVFHDIDLALLPIGGHFTMDPRQAAYACKMLGCRKVVPMHWGTFPILEQGTEEFAKQLDDSAPDTELLHVAPGETIDVEK
jgi:Predicted Zn-dependent hydrolases of the beta-lactamase fold